MPALLKKSDHSILSASSCERWWNCPGSIKMVEKYPTQPNKYMAEGTVAHGIAADVLRGKIKNMWDCVGDTREQEGFIVKVTEEMITAVEVYVEYINSKRRPGDEIFIEEKIALPLVHSELFATPDCRLILPYEKIYIFDLKYGAGKKVTAWENKQLLYYAIYDALRHDVKEIEITIVQPRINGNPISTFNLTFEQLMAFKEELASRSKTALDKKAPLIAGDWCHKTFCPALAECPKAQDHAREVVRGEFSSPVNPSSLSMTQIKKVLDNAEFVSNWLTKVKDHAKELALLGEKIPGYKLAMSYGHRKWKSEEAVVADFASLGEKLYEEPALKSPSKLEKLIGKKEIEPYVYKPENGYKLVTEEEEAEEVKTIKASDDFKKEK